MAIGIPIRDDHNRDRLKDLYGEGVITKDFVRSLLDKHHISLESYLYIIHPEEEGKEKSLLDKMFEGLHEIDKKVEEVTSPTGTKYFVGIDEIEQGSAKGLDIKREVDENGKQQTFWDVFFNGFKREEKDDK
jgi:hypothetical protein